MTKKPFQSYIDKEFNNSNKGINLFPDFSYKEPIPSSLAKSKDSRNNNLKKVHFKNDLNIELSLTKSNDISGEGRITKKDTERFSKTDTERISKNETEDDDILKKFQIDSYRKTRKKHFKLREQGFSLVKSQIRDEFSLYKRKGTPLIWCTIVFSYLIVHSPVKELIETFTLLLSMIQYPLFITLSNPEF
jgi:hypothetical protein